MNNAGLELIKRFESFRSKPYLCPAGKATIGYGSTYYEDGRRVSLSDQPITEERACQLLNNSLAVYEATVLKYVKKPINENQFAALTSFVYNTGAANFAGSTLLKRVNTDPNHTDIREQFLKWKYACIDGQMVILPGLLKRRIAEANLYFTKP